MIEHYGKRMYHFEWKNFSVEKYRSSANRMRTAPLWGVRQQPMLMHDGKSLTFRDAIQRTGVRPAKSPRSFKKLSGTDQEAIVEFLKSL